MKLVICRPVRFVSWVRDYFLTETPRLIAAFIASERCSRMTRRAR